MRSILRLWAGGFARDDAGQGEEVEIYVVTPSDDRAFSLRTIVLPDDVGSCYQVTSVTANGRELLGGPVSGMIFTSGFLESGADRFNEFPSKSPAKIVIKAIRIGGASMGFRGAILGGYPEA
jgi:hypothetical protein